MNLAHGPAIAGDSARTTLAIQIEALLLRLNPSVALDRRRDDRVAIPVVFRLTPLDADRQPVECETAFVVGKNLSRRGLSFFHERPIPYRRALDRIRSARPRRIRCGNRCQLVPVHGARMVRKWWPAGPLGKSRLITTSEPSDCPAGASACAQRLSLCRMCMLYGCRPALLRRKGGVALLSAG